MGGFERKYLPEFVYGGIDGTVTTFAVVSGVMGASLVAILASFSRGIHQATTATVTSAALRTEF